MKVSCSTRAMALLSRLFTKAAGKRPKQLLDRYQAAGGTHIPIQLLVRDRTAR
jgi:hypothetical protein